MPCRSPSDGARRSLRFGAASAHVVVVALAAALGCTDVDVDTRADRAAIRGGVADSVDLAVVGIYDTQTNAACTGTLIAPRLVLTAQHCVAPLLAPGACAAFGAVVPASRLLVTTRSPISLSPGGWRSISEIVLPPGERVVCGHDVALLVLREALASTEAVPIAPRFDAPVVAGETYAALGYGQTSTTGDDSGLRRRLDGLTVACVGLDCAGGYEGEWTGERGVCAGDSGGPALDVAGRLIGVVSRGAYDCSSPVYASVHAWRAWIEAELERVHGSPPDGGALDASERDADTPDADAPDASDPLDGGAPDAPPGDASVPSDSAGTSPPSPEAAGCACVRRERSSAGLLGAALLSIAFASGRRRARSGSTTEQRRRS